jgi:hypothetical protein
MLPANEAIKNVESNFPERFDMSIPNDDDERDDVFAKLSGETWVALRRKSGRAGAKLRPGARDKYAFCRAFGSLGEVKLVR